jgi:hypothetical protein
MVKRQVLSRGWSERPAGSVGLGATLYLAWKRRDRTNRCEKEES